MAPSEEEAAQPDPEQLRHDAENAENAHATTNANDASVEQQLLQYKMQYVSRVPLLESLPEDARGKLAHAMTDLSLEPGQVLIQKGDVGTEMYFILLGSVEVLLDTLDDEPVAHIGAGDFFGEMALLQAETRSAFVRAAEPVDLFVLTKDDLLAVVEAHPELESVLRAAVERRLQERSAVAPSEEEGLPPPGANELSPEEPPLLAESNPPHEAQAEGIWPEGDLAANERDNMKLEQRAGNRAPVSATPVATLADDEFERLGQFYAEVAGKDTAIRARQLRKVLKKLGRKKSKADVKAAILAMCGDSEGAVTLDDIAAWLAPCNLEIVKSAADGFGIGLTDERVSGQGHITDAGQSGAPSDGRVVAVNGVSIGSMSDLLGVVQAVQVGESARFTIQV